MIVIVCVCVCFCVQLLRACISQRTEDSFQKSVLSFHHVNAGDWTQVVVGWLQVTLPTEQS